MRVLVLTPYPYGTAGGPRSSIELWEAPLREAGITFEYVVFETDELHRIIYQPRSPARKAYEMSRAYLRLLPELRKVKDCDAVLIYREAALIGPALVERWIARQGKPIIYQLDDPLYIPYRSPSNGLLSYLKFFGKVKAICAMSQVVLANSPSNVAYAKRYNSNVWEIPSIVDGTIYDGWRTPMHPDAPVCVGWSGSPSTVPNLQVVREPLRAIGERKDAVVHLIGAADFGLPDVKHTGSVWNAATEVDDLRKFDVGLVPLPLTAWTPHKFYLKLVQYMALGIPPVATPLGANPIVIDDGNTGFLASDSAAWIAAIERLVQDPDLRADMGQRAAQVAHDRYTMHANSEKIVAAFRSALA